MSGLLYAALALLPLLAAPAAQAPTPAATVQATNHALAEAVRCTTRTQAQPFPGCAPLEKANAERVRFPEFGNSGHPENWTQALDVRLNDGAWRHYEEMHRSFHGMLWVPEIGLYVGYADWYGEEGGTVMIHPGSGDLVVVKGVPQLSPDRKLLLAAGVDVYSDGELRVQVFAMEPAGPRLLSDRREAVQGDQVQQVLFVPERSAAVVYLRDGGERAFGVSVDLSAHWPAQVADLLSVEACEQSETARYVTGDQVYLRSGPAKDAKILAALPWGSCVQLQETPGDWELVRMADQTGFVSAKLLVETAPDRGSNMEDFSDRFCRASPIVATEHGGADLNKALRANQAAGLEHYYARPDYDEHCYSLRPIRPPYSVGDFERVDRADLNIRFATWTLALAPEHAYRTHSSAAVLNNSPLFRAFPGSHSPNRGVPIYQGGSDWEQSLAQLFGSSELRKSMPPPTDVHLLHVVPQGDRLVFSADDRSQELGVAQGAFPAGRFQLSEDMSVARFDRDLPAAVLDPCSAELLPTAVTDVSYELATGVLSASIEAGILERLTTCMESMPKEHYPQLRFVLLVDESEEARALAATSSNADRRVLSKPSADGMDAMELRWSEQEVDQAFLRVVVYPDCSVQTVAVFQFYQDGEWQRVQSEIWDSIDCDA